MTPIVGDREKGKASSESIEMSYGEGDFRVTFDLRLLDRERGKGMYQLSEAKHGKGGGIGNAAVVVLVLASLVMVVSFLVILSGQGKGHGTFWDNLHWDTTFVAAAILAWLGVREASEENFQVRRWLAWGLSANALGQILWNVQVICIEKPPVPNIADTAFLLVGVCFVTGFWEALRRRQGLGTMRWAILDCAALCVAMLALALALYLPYLGSYSALQLIVLAAYPATLLSAACVGIIVVLTMRAPPDRHWMLFSGALVIYGGLWMKWNSLALADILEEGSALNLLFSVTSLAMGAGAMIWNTGGLPDPGWKRCCDTVLRLLPLFLVIVAGGSLAVTFTQERIPEIAQYAIGSGALLVIILAMIRQSMLLSQTDKLLMAEQRTKESEEKYRRLFETAQDAILVMEGATFTDCNESTLRIFGCDRETVMGRLPEDFSPERQLDGSYSKEKIVKMETQALAGKAQAFEWRFCRKSGAEFDAEVTLTRIDLVDKVLLLASVRDLSERKLVQEALHMSDQKFSSAFEHAPIGKALVAPDGQWLKVNKALRQILGYSWGELHGKSFQEITHPEDLEGDLSRVKQLLAGEIESYQMEKRYFHKDGHVVPVLLSVSLVRDSKDQPLYFISQIQDVTQRKQLEQQFLQAQKMEAMGTLAGGIAHDFNNILAAMNGYTELARMEVMHLPVAEKYLDSVLQAGTRAAELVRQILAFSRHQGSKRVSLSLAAVVEDAMKLLRATIPSTIEFKVLLSPDLPPVLGDATQIHQVLMNLGTNAWHSMKDQPGQLEIALETYEMDRLMAEAQIHLRPGPYLRLSVRDTGRGMDRTTLARIFEPFFTTKAPGQGTGLGLSVVHGIMKNHEGAVNVYSQPGEGTVFHLFFPVHQREIAPVSEQSDPAPSGNGERILFVDDEAALAELGKKVLELLGYRVKSFNSVLDAMAEFQAHPADYDLVVSDQAMPKMSGIDFAAQLLQVRKDIPIILATGYASSLTVERVKELGIRDLLLKPLCLQSLGKAVHEVLSKKK